MVYTKGNNHLVPRQVVWLRVINLQIETNRSRSRRGGWARCPGRSCRRRRRWRRRWGDRRCGLVRIRGRGRRWRWRCRRGRRGARTFQVVQSDRQEIGVYIEAVFGQQGRGHDPWIRFCVDGESIAERVSNAELEITNDEWGLIAKGCCFGDVQCFGNRRNIHGCGKGACVLIFESLVRQCIRIPPKPE